ncbi:50S ribosomal protein L23 [Lacticigenium naphthae]|uniref:50S ribosomal protein L23 n=1 Tax=Lacticigenium naphthae TaxID=515351 RepID=UPI0003F7FDCF|nr:50S ribosomal protein L23 [Lacticigenium naphthae]
MDARDVVKRPIITEASMFAMEDKKYTFEVDLRANKTEVRQAVEKLFGVKVKKVNIVNTPRKLKRMGKYSGYTKKRRKAIVSLTDESNDITLFEKSE